MTVTTGQLKEHVGSYESDNDDLLEACLAEAIALVDQYRTRGYGEDLLPILTVVPEPVLDRAYKEVAADLFHRRNAPNGIANAQFQSMDGVGAAPVRIARDPMLTAHKLLGRWVTPW